MVARAHDTSNCCPFRVPAIGSVMSARGEQAELRHTPPSAAVADAVQHFHAVRDGTELPGCCERIKQQCAGSAGPRGRGGGVPAPLQGARVDAAAGLGDKKVRLRGA